MKQFIDYLSRYDAEIISTFRGASEEKIDKLENLAKDKLPEDYKEFLRLTGEENLPTYLVGRNWTDAQSCIKDLEDLLSVTVRNVKAIFDFEKNIAGYYGKTDTYIDQRISMYQDYEWDGIQPPYKNDDKIEIAVCYSYGEYFVNVQTNDVERDYTDEIFIKLSDSLESFLCSNVFTHFEIEAKQYKNYYSQKDISNPQLILAEIEQSAAQTGLTKQWFSDSVRFHAVGDGKSVMAYHSNIEGLKLAIAAETEKKFNELKEFFVNQFQLNEFSAEEKWMVRQLEKIK